MARTSYVRNYTWGPTSTNLLEVEKVWARITQVVGSEPQSAKMSAQRAAKLLTLVAYVADHPNVPTSVAHRRLRLWSRLAQTEDQLNALEAAGVVTHTTATSYVPELNAKRPDLNHTWVVTQPHFKEGTPPGTYTLAHGRDLSLERYHANSRRFRRRQDYRRAVAQRNRQDAMQAVFGSAPVPGE